MTIFTVDTNQDVVNAGDGMLSLREAVQRANATAAADTILFAGALEGRTLTLTQGQLTLFNDVAIDGDRNDDGREVTVSGGDAGRVLDVVGASTEASLADLGITGGRTYAADGAGIHLTDAALSLTGCTVSGNRTTGGNNARGAGIAVDRGRLTIADSSIVDNVADGSSGGALWANRDAVVAISDSRITGNEARRGGAIGLYFYSQLTLRDSIVSDNHAVDVGGAIAMNASLLGITASTIADNSAQTAGGLFVSAGRAVIAESTIAGNTASSPDYGRAGGIWSLDCEVALRNSTVTGNGGPGVGGILFEANDGARLEIANSIVAGNFRTALGRQPLDIVGAIVSNGHNVFGSDVAGSAAGDVESVSPATLFAAVDPDTGGGLLASNGGPTPTVALLDAITNRALSGAEPIAAGGADQRGIARPQPEDGSPDVGAFELGQTAISTVPSTRNDRLAGTAVADALAGGLGNDLLLGRAGDDTLRGERGGDALRGGLGDDLLDGGSGLDTASFRGAGAAVRASIQAGTATGPLGADTLIGIENLEGGNGADHLTGDGLVNWLGGRDGNDRLLGSGGDDQLRGGAGADLLRGGMGADTQAGGGGADRFDYDDFREARVGADELIVDFRHLVDRIDLSTIDAVSFTPGVNERFTFLGEQGGPLNKAGQVQWHRFLGEIVVEANVDGGRGADLAIQVIGAESLSVADFIL